VNFRRPELNFCWQFSQKVLLRARWLATKWATTTWTLSLTTTTPKHGRQGALRQRGLGYSLACAVIIVGTERQGGGFETVWVGYLLACAVIIVGMGQCFANTKMRSRKQIASWGVLGSRGVASAQKRSVWCPRMLRMTADHEIWGFSHRGRTPSSVVVDCD
jgi:hypothetical protein